MFVWRSLLRLPENHAAYSSLTDKGLHPAFLAMHHKYPIKSHKLQRGLQRVLSALAHWAAIFGEVEYLPLVAFPFVKLFQNNPMLCFEVVASVLVNWGQHWFEYFPNPPLNILGMAENVLAHHDQELLQHLVDCGVTSQLYVWPLLETLFSEVLTRDEWLRLFDNVFSNHPAFLLMACVAYVSCCREPLLRCSHKHDFELTPLTEGQYPVFNHYPEFIVEYQSREREKIRLQEKEYLRERQEVSTLRTDFVRRQAEEEAYFAQQNAEEQRRNLLAQEEEKLTEQRARLTAMKRELKVKELQLLDATKRRFLKHQQELRATQVQRLDQEISRKMDLRERETAAAVQDLEVRQMELEAQRRLLEQNMFKVQERTGQEVEEETEKRMRRAEKEDESYTEMLHSTEANMQALEESLAEACQLDLDSRWQSEVAQRLQQVDAERDRKREKLKELHRLTAAGEERLAGAVRDVAGRKWDDVMRSRAQLQEQRQAASAPDGQSRTGVRSASSTSGLLHGPAAGRVRTRPAPAEQTGADPVCLNSSSPSQSTSTNFSLDRGRAQLDSSERQLLKDIRERRQELLLRAREGSSAWAHGGPPSGALRP
ncbi:TBC1 domain family member 31 [Liparis tanakae]|uniref:TBC1 domain family member 31 n=1 Tax=Liparis tanakae TaxID=230148 RepID=A0A4Z2EVZ3_9TELE|nr:TBC1 domain family member 31 [Liparis tanakae]